MFIEDSELVRLDEKRTTSNKLKPSNQFTGINPKRIGIRIRKLLNYILNFDSKYVHFIKSCYKSGINTHHHTFLENFIQGNDIIELFYYFFLSNCLKQFFFILILLQKLNCFLTCTCCHSIYLNLKNKPISTPYPHPYLLTNCFPKASHD